MSLQIQLQNRPTTEIAYKDGCTEKSLTVRLATSPVEVLMAQRLRHQVFLEKFGVSCGSNSIDADEFDAYCEHLIVIDEKSQQIVGTYRMLNPAGVERCGKFYGEQYFSSPLWHQLKDNVVELGRASIHQNYRSGTTLLLLWQGIMNYLSKQHVRYAIGYASVGLRDGGCDAVATELFLKAKCKPWSHASLTPIRHYPVAELAEFVDASLGEPPSLIRGYVRMGAFCIGEPVWDTFLNTADYPMLLDLTQLENRYARHFLPSKNLLTLN